MCEKHPMAAERDTIKEIQRVINLTLQKPWRWERVRECHKVNNSTGKIWLSSHCLSEDGISLHFNTHINCFYTLTSINRMSFKQCKTRFHTQKPCLKHLYYYNYIIMHTVLQDHCKSMWRVLILRWFKLLFFFFSHNAVRHPLLDTIIQYNLLKTSW